MMTIFLTYQPQKGSDSNPKRLLLVVVVVVVALFLFYFILPSLPVCFTRTKMLYDRGCIWGKKGAGIARKTQQSSFGLAVDYDVMVSQLGCDWLEGS